MQSLTGSFEQIILQGEVLQGLQFHHTEAEKDLLPGDKNQLQALANANHSKIGIQDNEIVELKERITAPAKVLQPNSDLRRIRKVW